MASNYNIDPDPPQPRQLFRIDRPDGMYPFGLRLRYALRQHDGSLLIAKPVELVHVKPEETGVGEFMPTIPDITWQGAQMLMDELWNAGVRPGDIGTAGHLQATQQHLADMRALVSHYTNATLPPNK